MTRSIERELTRTLNVAAGRAPRPEPGLLDQVEQRRRRRARRAQIAVATGAVLAVAGGSALTFGTSGLSGRDTTFTPADPPISRPARAKPDELAAEPIQAVWPAAVHDIPNRLDDGRKFWPHTMVDDHTLLVSIDASFENAGELWLYDIEDRTARKVTTVRTPKDATVFASNFTVGEGHVVWWIARPDNGKAAVELWAAPLRGGKAHLVSRVQAEGGVEGLIAIEGSMVHWSLSGGGVYRAPLTGGDAELLEGTQEATLVDWPWVGSPVRSLRSGTMPDEITYRTLRNLETGEERVATERDGAWTCRVRWCVGSTNHGGAVQRRDGSGRREVGSVMTTMTYGNQPARDRFVLVEGRNRSVIYDAASGKAGRVAALDGGGFRLMGDERLYFVETKKGYQVVDLAAIEASDPGR
jgi:hypothetical protein